MSNVKKNDRPLAGVMCTVTNCEYHGESNECDATSIEVCTCDPVQQCSVQCKTFKPKAGR
ncbi:MAG: DUF1540 domain-containing protein [Clostridia bacterium]|nr:DUF1540 domain-containing protein [Clostridia bacterium]